VRRTMLPVRHRCRSCGPRPAATGEAGFPV
jgi:hypothetical protein